jgi:serine phosphatase RsbU (regulator of sigma subunit)
MIPAIKNILCLLLFLSTYLICYSKDIKFKKLLADFESAKIDTTKFIAGEKLFHYYIEKGELKLADEIGKICINIANTKKTNILLGLSKKIEASLATEMGEYIKAIELYQSSNQFFSQKTDKEEIATSANSIGQIYFKLGKFDEALKYFKESMSLETTPIRKENCLLNIGVIHAIKKEYNKAENCFLLVKKGYEERKDSLRIASAYNNLGLLSNEQGNKIKGIQLLTIAYNIKMRMGQSSDKIEANYTLGEFYLAQNNYSKAKIYIDEEAKYIDTNIKNVSLKDYYSLLADYFEGVNDYKKALKFTLKYDALNAKLNNDEKLNEIQKSEIQKEFSLRIMADSIKNTNANQLNQLKIAEQTANLNKEKILRYALIFGLIMLSVMGYFIYKRFKESRAQNSIIESQNLELAKKNKETEDSLIYASRLQNGILPKIQELKKDFKDAFILYQPKDIVSGDFYWTYKIENKIFIAVGDCTGHGVPGAMMSFLSFNNLERCVKESGLSSTSEILEKLSLLIEQSFGFEEKAIRDGLDIALIKIDLTTKVLSYSGANNNLYLIKENELIKVKANRRSIGYSEFKIPFTEASFNLNSNDTLFLITDGYADQIGGDKNRKYMTKNLEALFLKIKNKDADSQKLLLSTELKEWMKEKEQVDDITVLGLTIA